MPWGFAIAAVATIGSAEIQSNAADKAAKAQAHGADAATLEQQREFDAAAARNQPFVDAGYGALKREEDILNGDYSGFDKSPDYVYARQQMQQGQERGAASRGSLYSGGESVDLATAMNGIASQNLNNYWAKLAGQAGQGYNAVSNTNALGQSAANQIGSNAMYAGDARANGYARTANAWSNAAQSFAGMGGQYASQNGWGGI